MKLFRRKTEEEAVRQEIAVKEAAPFEPFRIHDSPLTLLLA